MSFEEEDEVRAAADAAGPAPLAVSLVVTPNHDMYAARGRLDDSGRLPALDRLDMAKVKARDLVSADARDVARLATRASGGVRPSGAGREASRLGAPLGLTSECQWAAFLELVGYWVGSGFITECGRAGFGVPGDREAAWLEERLLAAGLAEGTGFSSSGSGLVVERGGWGAFFAVECRGAPQGSKDSGAPARLEDLMAAAEARSLTGLDGSRALPGFSRDLDRGELRAVLAGLGTSQGRPEGCGELLTTSADLRDQLVTACLHAGFSAHFAAAGRGVKGAWVVRYREDEAHAMPVVRSSQDVRLVEYEGRTWCVSMPSGFVVARRALMEDGALVGASAATICGNCWTTEMEDDGDPPRLWLPNAMFPGTAFTRSIGDSVAERIGVVAVPEICLKRLSGRSKFAVIASDGVFEFLASQNVADILNRRVGSGGTPGKAGSSGCLRCVPPACRFDDPLDGARAVVSESYRLWLEVRRHRGLPAARRFALSLGFCSGGLWPACAGGGGSGPPLQRVEEAALLLP